MDKDDVVGGGDEHLLPQKASFRHPSPQLSLGLLKLFLRTVAARYLCIVFVIIGAIVFGLGFLAIRSTPQHKSSCEDPPGPSVFLPKSKNGCWLPNSSRPKIVILLIDALRTDFALPSIGNNSKTYLDKLNVLYEMVQQQPQYSRLIRFIADPPTATTQRLQGLTAGSLPVFIEVAGNFNSQEYSADNIIYQMLHENRNSTSTYSKMSLFGDDTWLSLFPYMKEKSLGTIDAYHSFHLFDLHTVDTAIKEKLFPALESKSDNLVIAHFLGLDHCGHKYGPNHLHCSEKLEELDKVIRQVLSTIDDNTVLLVFGDHGMTEEGDHGGSSAAEVSSVLFVHSKRPFMPISKGNSLLQKALADESLHWSGFYKRALIAKERQFSLEKLKFYSDRVNDTILSGTINQIGLVPSLSLLAGLPIPFGNVGSLVPEFLFDNAPYEAVTQFCQQNECNEVQLSFLMQICRLKNYQKMVEGVRMNAHQVLRYFKSLSSDPGFKEEDIRSLNLELSSCEVTSQFTANTDKEVFTIDLDSLLKGGLAAVDTLAAKQESDPLILLNIALDELYLRYTQLLVSCLSHGRSVWASFNHPLMYMGIALMTLGCAIGSLSFISPIGPAQLFVDTLPALFLSFLHVSGFATTSFLKFEDSIVHFLLISLVLYQIFLRRDLLDAEQQIKSSILVLLIVLGRHFGTCREEQFPFCHLWHHRLWTASLSWTFLVTLSIGAIFLVIFSVWHLSTFETNEPVFIFRKVLFVVNLLALAMFWTWTWISDTSDLAKIAFSRITLVSEETAKSCLSRLLIILPGFSYAVALMTKKARKQSLDIRQATVTCALFFGAISRPFGGWVLLCIGCPLMILGYKLFKSDSLLLTLYVNLAGLFLFFITGHQATISSIQWESAFIGTTQSYPQAISFILLMMNTFSGPIIATIFLTMINGLSASILLVLVSWEMLFSTLFLPFLLRHLMIWQIFTPRFLMQFLLLVSVVLTNAIFRLA